MVLAEVDEIETMGPEAGPVTVNFTVPVKLFRLFNIIPRLVEFPASILTLAGLELRLKSNTLIVRLVVWERIPLVPFTVTK